MDFPLSDFHPPRRRTTAYNRAEYGHSCGGINVAFAGSHANPCNGTERGDSCSHSFGAPGPVPGLRRLFRRRVSPVSGVRKWNMVIGVPLHRTARSNVRPAFADWHTESRLVACMTHSTTTTTPQKVVLGFSRRIAKSAQVTQPRPDRILVVADEVSVAGFLRDALTECGYAVAVAVGGADALNKATEDAPDVVLLDLNLPDIPGFEVLERLRARASTVPVIIVSGNTDPMMAEAARALGALAYITKPVEFDVLSRAVAMTLRRCRQLSSTSMSEARRIASASARGA